jgi:hypothetical protein
LRRFGVCAVLCDALAFALCDWLRCVAIPLRLACDWLRRRLVGRVALPLRHNALAVFAMLGFDVAMLGNARFLCEVYHSTAHFGVSIVFRVM